LRDYAALLAAEGGVCLICGDSPPEGENLCVDHDADYAGRVRSLLCHFCNRALGMLKHDPAIIARSLQYVEDNHAISRMAITEG
jgi:hypothetical protein